MMYDVVWDKVSRLGAGLGRGLTIESSWVSDEVKGGGEV